VKTIFYYFYLQSSETGIVSPPRDFGFRGEVLNYGYVEEVSDYGGVVCAGVSVLTYNSASKAVLGDTVRDLV